MTKSLVISVKPVLIRWISKHTAFTFHISDNLFISIPCYPLFQNSLQMKPPANLRDKGQQWLGKENMTAK